MKTPIEKLVKSLFTDKNVNDEAVLITSDINRRYFSSFQSSAGYVLITKDETYLIVDFRYFEAAKLKSKNVTVIKMSNLKQDFSSLVSKHSIKKIHLENDRITFAGHKQIKDMFSEFGVEIAENNDLIGVIKSIRMYKSDDEIKQTIEAQRLTDEAFNYILPKIKEGVTEREIALDIEFFMRKNGAERVAFDLIVVAGTKSSMCHGVPGDNIIKKGDFITMDTGAVVGGYHSDMTRTVALGCVTDEQKAVYNKVLEAHMAVLDAIKPGEVCSDIDKIARDIIDAEYSGAFGHSLGHGVGFEVHEFPVLSSRDNTILEKGMLVTDEPGIYLEGKFGVRIEDLVLVTENGNQSLTKSPKELIIL